MRERSEDRYRLYTCGKIIRKPFVISKEYVLITDFKNQAKRELMVSGPK